VTAIVPARVIHKESLAALGPGFAAAGFKRLMGTFTAAWVRATGGAFVVHWLQPSRYPDPWYDSKYTIEFRCGNAPAIALSGPSFRFCALIGDDAREQVRAVQNAIIGRIPRPPDHLVRQLAPDLQSPLGNRP
jgi:hypothetical protein